VRCHGAAHHHDDQRGARHLRGALPADDAHAGHVALDDSEHADDEGDQPENDEQP
jgi:hypothetical protein